MRHHIWLGPLIFLTVFLGSALDSLQAQEEPAFYIRPYLQLGNNPKLLAKEQEEILWGTRDHRASWSVETKLAGENEWRKQGATTRSLTFYGGGPLYVVHCPITGLTPGGKFDYRVLKNGTEAFSASALARKPKGVPVRAAVYGDLGYGTFAESKVAYQCFQRKPDFVVMLGDIVYTQGRISEYLSNFFPQYNADRQSLLGGAPILRSILCLGVIGNHDLGIAGANLYPNLDMCPDCLAFFRFWSEPLNGPVPHDGINRTKIFGAAKTIQEFEESVGQAFPRMTNYSFDYGNTHWLVIDCNHYMRLDEPSFRQWVEADLSKVGPDVWKFACFHQPGFSCDRAHYTEQRARLLCDLFEKYGVDIVFAGHAHNYQRTYPLKFKIKSGVNPDGTVDGDLSLDKSFDGEKNTKMNGVMYIVSGGGGAPLYAKINDLDSKLFPYTYKFSGYAHSLSLMDINGKSLTFKQVSEDGAILDQFTVTK